MSERDLEIRAQRMQGVSVGELAAQYGLGRSRIKQIVTGIPTRGLAQGAASIRTCAQCGAGEAAVKDTRTTFDGSSVRRRRECRQCGGRWTTYEFPESVVEQMRNERRAAAQLISGLRAMNAIANHLAQPQVERANGHPEPLAAIAAPPEQQSPVAPTGAD